MYCVWCARRSVGLTPTTQDKKNVNNNSTGKGGRKPDLLVNKCSMSNLSLLVCIYVLCSTTLRGLDAHNTNHNNRTKKIIVVFFSRLLLPIIHQQRQSPLLYAISPSMLIGVPWSSNNSHQLEYIILRWHWSRALSQSKKRVTRRKG